MAHLEVNELIRSYRDVELTPTEFENILAGLEARGMNSQRIRENEEYLKPRKEALRRALARCGINFEQYVRGELPPLTPEQHTILLEEFEPLEGGGHVPKKPPQKGGQEKPNKENPSE